MSRTHAVDLIDSESGLSNTWCLLRTHWNMICDVFMSAHFTYNSSRCPFLRFLWSETSDRKNHCSKQNLCWMSSCKEENTTSCWTIPGSRIRKVAIRWDTYFLSKTWIFLIFVFTLTSNCRREALPRKKCLYWLDFRWSRIYLQKSQFCSCLLPKVGKISGKYLISANDFGGKNFCAVRKPVSALKNPKCKLLRFFVETLSALKVEKFEWCNASKWKKNQKRPKNCKRPTAGHSRCRSEL